MDNFALPTFSALRRKNVRQGSGEESFPTKFVRKKRRKAHFQPTKIAEVAPRAPFFICPRLRKGSVCALAYGGFLVTLRSQECPHCRRKIFRNDKKRSKRQKRGKSGTHARDSPALPIGRGEGETLAHSLHYISPLKTSRNQHKPCRLWRHERRERKD